MAAAAWAQSPLPADEEIRKILADRIDVQHRSVGIVVGIVGPEGRRIVAYGHLEKGDSRPLNGDTVFEIGSTKAITSSRKVPDNPSSKYFLKATAIIFSKRQMPKLPLWWINRAAQPN
ncbi:MAG TPA: hypothetical protein VKY85_26520 [Candidatus Angelobacter sp.]|nr:hypothetical protein [Candidatus Angelobacter sp.]